MVEANRWLSCAVGAWSGLCDILCEVDARRYNAKAKEKTLDVGAISLAPGFDLYDAEKKGEYGYRRFPNVISGLDCERLLSASGPCEGHLQRPSDGVEPKKIAFLQCVGSRDKDNPYCSVRLCRQATTPPSALQAPKP